MWLDNVTHYFHSYPNQKGLLKICSPSFLSLRLNDNGVKYAYFLHFYCPRKTKRQSITVSYWIPVKLDNKPATIIDIDFDFL